MATAQGGGAKGAKPFEGGVRFGQGAGPEAAAKGALEAVARAAAAACAPGSAEAAAAEEVANAVASERNWRATYWRHLVRSQALLARPECCAAAAAAGLGQLWSSFELADEAGGVRTLQSAVEAVPGLVPDHGGFDRAVVVGGKAAAPPGPLRVPVKGQVPLEGGALEAQLARWTRDGIMEPEAAASVGALAKAVAVDLTGLHVACLGAGSEMGPARTLLELGATVYAVDIPRPRIWRQLASIAAETRGTLVMPLRRRGGASGGPRTLEVAAGDEALLEECCEAAGCDILSQVSEVAAWLCAQAPGQRLCVGAYTYLDGAKFIRIALACDAVIAAVAAARPDTATALLCSPSECYAVPAEAFEQAQARYASPPAGVLHRAWYEPLRVLSRGRYLVPNGPAELVDLGDGKPPIGLADCYIWQQGPNYAFAKLLQRWRVLLMRSQGHVVSANIGPATMTSSIMVNNLISAGMIASRHFGIENFYGDTSSSLMAALLIHDLTCEASAANPATPLRSPLQLFSENAIHGGVWRAAFQANSYTEVCAVVHVANKARPWVASAASMGLAGAATKALLPRARL